MKKQIIFILFVLLVLFSVASVSAEDNQTNDNLAIANIDVSGDSFTDIDNAIQSASASSVLYLNNKTYTGTSEITITKSITINGGSADNPNGMSTLNGQNLTRIFKANPGVTVTLQNLVLANGSCVAPRGDAAGSAFYGFNINSLNLVNVVFENNTALEGGAVYVQGKSSTQLSKLDINNCTFINNKGSSGAGAVYVYNDVATIADSKFINNTALKGNATGNAGGAIYNYGDLAINNCYFENNTGLYAGAIVNEAKTLTITNSEFIANLAVTNSGSAIFNYNTFANLKVDNCSFEYNVANDKGSGIYNYLGNVEVSNSTFYHNVAGSSALLFNDGGVFNITNSNFTGNVGVNGSVIYNQNCTSWGFFLGEGRLTINNSTFAHNVPINGTEIYNGGDLKLLSSSLNGNYTLIQNYGKLTLADNNLTSDAYLSIYNNGGTFTNPLKLIVLDNTTVKAFINQSVNISAILLDSDNNTVGDTSFKFLVNGSEVNGTLYKNGTYKKELSFDKSGIYPVSALITSNGNKYLLENGTLEILPQPQLAIKANNTTYLNDSVIEISSENLTNDNIAVIIKNNNGTVVYNSSQEVNTEFNVNNLDAGNYTVIANFTGNDQYSPVVNYTNFEVAKASLNLVVSVLNITYGEVAVCNVSLGNINGTINLTVNNKTYAVDLTNGNGSVEVSDLDAGNYTASASFAGDKNYLPVSNSTDFEVAKINPLLIISADNITYGDIAVIRVGLDNVSASLNITVNNETYEVNLTNGSGSLTIPNLDAGSYTVVAQFGGNANYASATNSTIFNVAKISSVLNITTSNITYGDVAKFNISLENISGSVNVTVNGVNYTVDLVNGSGSLEVSSLDAGNYTALVSFNGNTNYLPANNSTDFEVAKINLTLNITASNVTYGNPVKVDIALGNITGSVNVTIDGVNYTADLENGKASLNVSNLNAGNYSAIAIFNGTVNYSPVTNSTTFEVSKISENLVISLSNITYGDDLLVNVSLGNVSGEVTIDINGTDYTVDLVNGSGSVVVSNLNAGNYSAIAKFNGTTNYLPATNSSDFKVSKINLDLIVSISNITYGDVAICNVTLGNVSGKVTINVNGTNYTVSVVNGSGSVAISNLDAGNYTAVANFDDVNYIINNNSTVFEVAKAESILIIEVDNITYGDVAIVKVGLGNISDIGEIASTISAISLGDSSVDVTVGNKSYTVDLNNGVGVLKVPKLDVGNYTASATYEGSNNYLAANNATTFEVSPVESLLNITMDNIAYGDVAHGKITVTDINGTPLNGTATVTIDNNTFDVAISEGVGNILFNTTLNPGSYNASAVFKANNTLNASNSTIFTVTQVNLTVSNITIPEGENGTVNITTSIPVNGTVNVSFNGANFTVDLINGVGVFKVPNTIPVGNYTVAASLGPLTASGNVEVTEVIINSTDNDTGDPIENVTGNETVDNSTNTTEDNATSDNQTEDDGSEDVIPEEDVPSVDIVSSEEISDINNTNNALKHIDSGVKTGNPIALLLLTMFLVPLRRKFRR